MRLLSKTISYGVMHFTVAIGVAYAVSGSWTIAIGIGLIEPAVQTMVYAVHERIWESDKHQFARPLRRQLGRWWGSCFRLQAS